VKKILFVSSQALFRGTRFGGAKRLYYLAKELESRAELHVICLDGCQEIPRPADFPKEFRQVLFLPQKRSRWWARWPFLSDSREAFRAHRTQIALFVEGVDFDAVLMAFPGALHFRRLGLGSPGARAVYLEDDLILEQSKVQIREARNPGIKFLKKLRQRQGVNFFRSALRGVSKFICISPQEAEIVRQRWPEIPTTILGYGIPMEKYPRLAFLDHGPVLGFIGNYRHLPNLDAAHWLIETLFPDVQARIPGVRLVLCGAGFPDGLRLRCAAHSAITVLDEVDDLAEFYGTITVFVNALRQGRGLRTKVVESAAYGRPVLSTPLGAEGLEDFDLGLFTTGSELADRLVELENREKYARAAGTNRLKVEERFSMHEAGNVLMSALVPAPSERAHTSATG
jgi:glycosyltransferase involved in cell wall biosynthesis